MKKLSGPSILKVSVTIGDQFYEEDLAQVASFENNPEGLNKALAEHPGRFALWAMMEQLSRSRAENLAQDLRWLEGEEVERVTETLQAQGKKVPSITQLKSIVSRFPKVKALTKQVLAAKQDYRRIQVGKRTVEQKKDVVLAIAANMRGEMQRPPLLKDQVADAKERMKKFFGSDNSPRRSSRG